MLSKALEMGVCFHRVPGFGERGGAPFLGPLREGKHFFIYGNFFKEFERYVKKGPVNGKLSIGALVGELGGGSFTGTYFSQRKYIYLDSSFVDPEDIKN
jgi:hypothetical protein